MKTSYKRIKRIIVFIPAFEKTWIPAIIKSKRVFSRDTNPPIHPAIQSPDPAIAKTGCPVILKNTFFLDEKKSLVDY